MFRPMLMCTQAHQWSTTSVVHHISGPPHALLRLAIFVFRPVASYMPQLVCCVCLSKSCGHKTKLEQLDDGLETGYYGVSCPRV